MKELMQQFSMIENPRHPGYITHKTENILTIVMCGGTERSGQRDIIAARLEHDPDGIGSPLATRLRS